LKDKPNFARCLLHTSFFFGLTFKTPPKRRFTLNWLRIFVMLGGRTHTNRCENLKSYASRMFCSKMRQYQLVLSVPQTPYSSRFFTEMACWSVLICNFKRFWNVIITPREFLYASDPNVRKAHVSRHSSGLIDLEALSQISIPDHQCQNFRFPATSRKPELPYGHCIPIFKKMERDIIKSELIWEWHRNTINRYLNADN
jgi:hypothetical protein